MSQFLACQGGRKRGHKTTVKSHNIPILAIICVLSIGYSGQTHHAWADVSGSTAAVLSPAQSELLAPQVSVVQSQYSSSSLLVHLRPDASAPAVVRALRASGLAVQTHLNFPEYISVTAPPQVALSSVQSFLTGLPQVETAKPHLLLYQLDMPNDPLFLDTDDPESTVNQYYLYDVNAPQAWDLQHGSASTTIAIIDSGITVFHEDLASNIAPGWDFVGTNVGWMGFEGYSDDVPDAVGDSNPTVWDPAWGQPGDKTPPFPTIEYDEEFLPISDPDYCAAWWAANYDPALGDLVDNNMSYMGLDWDGGVTHGSMAAGIAGAVTDNGMGLAGMAWNCSLMPLRIINAEGWGFGIDAADAIIYAADHGADIINGSWGFGPVWSIDPVEFEEGGEAYLVQQAIEYAASKGVIMVFAAGNSGENPGYAEAGGGLDFPGNLPETISVGAIDWTATRSSYSSYASSAYGEVLDIVAPGDMMYTTSLFTPNMWYMSAMYYDIQYPLGEDTYEPAFGGTSFSAPIVSGFAGLLKTRYPGMTYTQFRDFIQQTAFDLGDPGDDIYYGYGRLDAYEAILYADANIPEPTTVALFAIGLAGLAARLRRRS